MSDDARDWMKRVRDYPLYRDKEGEPIDVERMHELVRDDDYKVIGLDAVGDRVVSTVWTGVDMNPFAAMGMGPPHIFESIVWGDFDDVEAFGQQVRVRDIVSGPYRYATEEQARAGHASLVGLARAQAPLEDEQG